MKKIVCLLLVALLTAMLCACNADDVTEKPGAEPEEKQDELTSVLYYPDDGEADAYLKAEDAAILLRVAKEADYTPDVPMNLSIKMDFVIRHYKEGENDFFAKSDGEYVDQDGNATKDYVDVRYYLCYETPMIVRMYKTAKGSVYEAAFLSEETVQELKDYFSNVESLTDA